MSDPDLLVFGCVVSFIAAAGVYVFMRGRYEERQRQDVEVQEPSSQPELIPVPVESESTRRDVG